MSTWKYTDADNRVVSRTLENGSTESCLVSAINEWIAAGNTPLPYEPPPVDRKPIILAELAALDLRKIRPISMGDTAYLAILNQQTAELQAELKGLK